MDLAKNRNCRVVGCFQNPVGFLYRGGMMIRTDALTNWSRLAWNSSASRKRSQGMGIWVGHISQISTWCLSSPFRAGFRRFLGLHNVRRMTQNAMQKSLVITRKSGKRCAKARRKCAVYDAKITERQCENATKRWFGDTQKSAKGDAKTPCDDAENQKKDVQKARRKCPCSYAEITEKSKRCKKTRRKDEVVRRRNRQNATE